jgi:hypothetical protein|tara:strand:- start:190 stop:456 length:267 start_codon:yes stop_codon:yes gene_type:complete
MMNDTTTLLSDSIEAINLLISHLEDAEWMPIEQLDSYVATGIILVHRIQNYDIGAFTDDEIHLINECADMLNYHTRQMFEGEQSEIDE